MKDFNYLILGCGGHGRYVVSLLNSLGSYSLGFIDTNKYIKADEQIMGIPVVTTFDDFFKNSDYNNSNIILGIGDIQKRRNFFNQLTENNYQLPNIIHPSAEIDSSAVLGESNVIGPKVVIGAEVIVGSNNIIYTSAVIEHQSVIGNDCNISPAVTICGNVNIGNRVFLGANCTIINNIKIISDTTLGAGAIVIRDIINKKGLKLAGNPAKEIK